MIAKAAAEPDDVAVFLFEDGRRRGPDRCPNLPTKRLAAKNSFD